MYGIETFNADGSPLFNLTYRIGRQIHYQTLTNTSSITITVPQMEDEASISIFLIPLTTACALHVAYRINATQIQVDAEGVGSDITGQSLSTGLFVMGY